MLTVTIDNILTLRPCYTRERLESLFGGRIHATPREIAAAQIVSAEDRAWVLLRLAPREVWLPAVYRAMERAIRHACRALDAAGLHDDAEELACATPAITSAEAAEDAARAAGDAARAARAAGDAAGAARDAARAARDAEYQLFLDDVARLIEEQP